jgi:hypothetical protein
MLTRRVALSMAALTALASMPVLVGTAPAGASGAVVSPSSRGKDNGDPEGPEKKEKKADEAPNNCPTKQWTVPLELKGLACLLLLPKPEPGGEGGGGLGGLFG